MPLVSIPIKPEQVLITASFRLRLACLQEKNTPRITSISPKIIKDQSCLSRQQKCRPHRLGSKLESCSFQCISVKTFSIQDTLETHGMFAAYVTSLKTLAT
jgi:hypothetical protein